MPTPSAGYARLENRAYRALSAAAPVPFEVTDQNVSTGRLFDLMQELSLPFLPRPQ